MVRAFWINFLPLFLLLWWAIDPLVTVFQDDAPRAYVIAMSYSIVAFGIILPWQVVGVLRTSERYLVDYGNPLWGRAAQALVIIATMAALIVITGAVQRIGARQSYHEFGKRWEAATSRVYDVTQVPGTTLARLVGDMQNGTTRVLEKWFIEHPNITGIILDSTGGRVYEGRGVARLVREKGLDTYTMTGCYSACTIAYIAGVKRFVVDGAKLGFHQYTYATAKNLGYLDSSAEQDKDLSSYRSRGIDEGFIERVFDASSSDMWFPDYDQLIASRVIDAVVDDSFNELTRHPAKSVSD